MNKKASKLFRLLPYKLVVLLCISLAVAGIMPTLAAEQIFETPKVFNTLPINFNNPSFETPVISVSDSNNQYPSHVNPAFDFRAYNGYYKESLMGGWLTVPVLAAHKTEPLAYVVQVFNGLGTSKHDNGMKPARGNQAAELSSHYPSRLYQICNTTPGTRIYWELQHAALQVLYNGSPQPWKYVTADMPYNLNNYKDVMNVYMYAQPGDHRSVPPSGSTQATCETSIAEGWEHFTGAYTVPSGQTKTVLAFEAVSSYTNDLTGGNLLDDIRVYISSFLEVSKSVSTKESQADGKKYALIGEIITYTIKVENKGESDASNVVLTDVLPNGVEFVPGSIKIDGANAGALGSYNAATETVRVNLGAKATSGSSESNGGLIKGTTSFTTDCSPSYTVSFQVKVTGKNKSVGDLIQNQAKVVYSDRYHESLGNMNNCSPIVDVILKDRSITNGIVWIDADENGNIGATTSERRLAGQPVWLLDNATGAQAMDINGTPLIATTDSNGKYDFFAIPAGTYKVRTDVLTDYKVSSTYGAAYDNKATQDGYIAYVVNIPLTTSLAAVGNNQCAATNQSIGMLPTYSIAKTASVNGAAASTGSSGSPIQIIYGDEIEYIITITNKGADAINKTVNISDLIPDGLGATSPITTTPAGTLTPEGSRTRASWTLPSLPAGTTTFKIKTKVDAKGEFINEATAQLASEEPTATNKTYHVANAVSFKITKELTTKAPQEEKFPFQISYRVNASSPVSNTFYGIVTVPKDSLSATIVFVDLTPGHYTIQEMDSNWRYNIVTPVEGLYNQTIVDPNAMPEFIFTNKYSNDQWISGKASVTNTMEPLP